MGPWKFSFLSDSFCFLMVLGNASKGKSHTGSGRKSRLMKTVQNMKNHGNYQNCTIVRPHIPHSSYGTYVTLAPKVLVFPVFVQVSSSFLGTSGNYLIREWQNWPQCFATGFAAISFSGYSQHCHLRGRNSPLRTGFLIIFSFFLYSA